MGFLGKLFSTFFGGGRNAVVEVAEVFRENAEAAGVRAATLQNNALGQFAAEFHNPNKGWFDRFMDGVNRIPRPALALGTLGLFVSAMFSPQWFAARMAGLATVPEPLWWLLGVVVSFYFGARFQAKGQEFQRGLVQAFGHVPLPPETPQTRDLPAQDTTNNAALDDWRRWRQNVP